VLQRLQRATKVIENDDAARDSVGLPKPSLEELTEMDNLKQLSSTQCDEILCSLGLANNPPGGVKDR